MDARIFKPPTSLPCRGRGKWDRNRRDAAINVKQNFLGAYRSEVFHCKGVEDVIRRRIVMNSVPPGNWVSAWRKSEGIPSDTPLAPCLTEIGCIEISAVGPPWWRADTFGVTPFRERHAHRSGFFLNYRTTALGFHSHGATQPKFESGIAKKCSTKGGDPWSPVSAGPSTLPVACPHTGKVAIRGPSDWSRSGMLLAQGRDEIANRSEGHGETNRRSLVFRGMAGFPGNFGVWKLLHQDGIGPQVLTGPEVART